MLHVTLLVLVVACRPTANKKKPSADAVFTADSVRAAEVEAVAAWNRGDLEAHVAIFADTGTGGPPMGPGGRARARASLAPILAGRRKLQVDSLRVSPLGAGYMLASGHWVLLGPGSPRSGWFTHVWAKLPQGWRVTYEHSQ